MLTQTIHTPDQQKWIAKLLGYDFEVHYRPGRENGPADALSRRQEGQLMTLQATSRPTLGILKALKELYDKNPSANQLRQAILQNPNEHQGYRVHDGLVLLNDRIYVPEDSYLHNLIIHEYHDTLVGGHGGVQRTIARVKANFVWANMGRDIKDYVARCATCQEVKAVHTSPLGTLQPLPIPKEVWNDVSMDFITQLPPSASKTAIMVVVDRLSKYAHFIAIPTGFTTELIAKIFMKEIVRLHGIPASIVSDRDPIFMSKMWRELFKMQGTLLATSSSYHPQTDGQTEVVNRCLEDYLRCYVSEHQKDWATLLPWAELSYNTAWHSAIRMTPFQAVYGRSPPTAICYTEGTSNVACVDDMLTHRKKLLEELKQNLAAAQQRMKERVDGHRKDKEFAVGDWVYVRLQPYRQLSVARRRSPKLARRYYGPFQIQQRVGKVAYQLALPGTAKIHNVFHISLLKEFKGDPRAALITWPDDFEVEADSKEPKHILGKREIKEDHKVMTQVLVQWQGQAEEDATWEDYLTFKERFPAYNLEDEVSSEDGGNVMMPARKRIPSNKYPSSKYVI